MEKIKYNYLRRALPWPQFTMKLRKDGEPQGDALPDITLLDLQDFIRLGGEGFLTGQAEADYRRIAAGEFAGLGELLLSEGGNTPLAPLVRGEHPLTPLVRGEEGEMI